jgi:DNA-binding transcriptional ArsR family regulator
LAPGVEGGRPKLKRPSPRQWAILMIVARYSGIYDGKVPLRVIQDAMCDATNVKRRRGVAGSARRLRRRGLLEADGRGRGIRYRLAPQLRELLVQLSNQNGSTFRRSRATKPVDSPWGTKLRILKMIVESRVGALIKDIAAKLGISEVATRYHVRGLEKLDLVTRPSPGLVTLAPMDESRVRKAIEDAGEWGEVLESLGLRRVYGKLVLEPFTTKEFANFTGQPLWKAQRILGQLRKRSIVIDMPGRKCRFKFYIINPIYPTSIPQHQHDKGTVHLYGGQRIWKRRRNRSSRHSCVRAGGIRGGVGGGCGGSCRF